ncbi:zinc protease [Pseudomonas lini]|jgi:zinc protease|uniref:M16 family metallopeptidase n=1 Tax=Pseudomonas lini TaxID=163011 RepID=UPI0027866333|nr:insulinase family protein [Pseudomonas lini]MDQ0126299.1 zinc protease [Pseudomonas lini]
MNIPTNELTSRPTHEITLDNGLKIIVREDHRNPEFCSTVVYCVGDSYENPEEWGLGSLLLYSLFDGYERETALAKELGGSSTGWGGENLSQVVRLPREHLETAFEIQSSIMTKDLQDEVIRRYLDLMILRSKKKSMFVSAISFSPELEALIEVGTSYYRPPEGITANLERLTVEQVKQWHKTWYGPNNAVLSIAGDITPDEVKFLAEKHFGSIPKCDAPHRPVARGPSAPGYRRITQHLDTSYPLMLIVFNTPSATATDHQTVRALQVIGALLSQATPAHLTTIGQNPALIRSNSHRYQRGDARLSFAYYFDGDPDEAEAGFWRLLEEVRSTPLSLADIEQAIDTVSTERQRAYDDIGAQSELIAMLAGNGYPWQLLDLEVAQLRSVTPADIQYAVQTCLTRDRVSVGHIFPVTQESGDIEE